MRTSDSVGHEHGANGRARIAPTPGAAGEAADGARAEKPVVRVAEAGLPTRAGDFRIAVFRVAGEAAECVVLLRGEVGPGTVPLVRLHSECLTGDALGSRRCDCGEQLEAALGLIAEAECGALLYLRQEGRGIGIANKIRAYALQDTGLDTVEANSALGLPVDSREYASAAAVLRHLGAGRVRLLTNNPTKLEALQRYGVRVVERVPLEAPPNPVNLPYLKTKAARMGHLLALATHDEQAEQRDGALGAALAALDGLAPPRGVGPSGRPFVTIHYAQTLDGRIATRTGNSQWISGDESLRLAHGLRASHQAVLVGIGTVLADNPKLTVRHVPGRSPSRVVVDSTLRLPDDANVLVDGAAPTLIATTERARPERIEALRSRGIEVVVAAATDDGRVELPDLMRRLGERGIASVLIEGGAGMITTALQGRLVDRLIVCIAPKVVGAGIEAVGDLDVRRLSDALTFEQARFTSLGADVVFDGLLAGAPVRSA